MPACLSYLGLEWNNAAAGYFKNMKTNAKPKVNNELFSLGFQDILKIFFKILEK